MSEESQKTTAIILKKLLNTPDEESIVSVFSQDLKERFSDTIQAEFSESAKKLWFPDEEVKTNLEKITADFRDTDSWKNILESYKEGEIEVEDLVDYICVSHLATDTDEIDPSRVMQRQVEQGLKSRVGARFLSNLMNATQKTLSASLEAICEYVALENPEMKTRLLGESKEAIKDNLTEKSLVPISEQVKQALVTQDGSMWDKESVESMISQMFAGDIIYDKLHEISFDSLIDKLIDLEDYDFDSTRTIIVDAGMEQANKALRREDYEDDPSKLRFALYTMRLNNIFDGFGGTHSDDRGVTKFVLNHSINEKEFLMLIALVKDRSLEYFQGRQEWSQMRMLWRSKEEIREHQAHPISKLTWYDKEAVLKTLYDGIKQKTVGVKALKNFIKQLEQTMEETMF